MVGTPDYIAPEVFGKEGYTETVDWWSLGAILFEMLVGYPPFFAENPSATCKKVLDWKNTFLIPKEARLSAPATDLLKRLICDPNDRLGINGVDEIKAHPFFNGVGWDRIRDKTAPNIPKLKHAEDTSIFDDFPEIEPWNEEPKDAKKHKKNRVNDVHFIGYTYKRSLENQKMQSIANLFEEIDNTRQSARQKTVDKDGYSGSTGHTGQGLNSASEKNINQKRRSDPHADEKTMVQKLREAHCPDADNQQHRDAPSQQLQQQQQQ